LRKVYQIHADYISKNSHHSNDMPIRSEKFDVTIKALMVRVEELLRKKRSTVERFLQLCRRNLNEHIPQLNEFASTRGGLMMDNFREEIWPVLARNIPDTSAQSSMTIATQSAVKRRDPCLNELRAHRDWNQVELDVKRTMGRIPESVSVDERMKLQKSLVELVMRLMHEDENFSYYQGFHDVCLTLLLVLEEETALNVGKSLVARASFSKYLVSPIDTLVIEELQYMYVILWLQDPPVETHIRLAELGTTFAMSWPLTWFSHDLRKHSQIVIFFDLLLSSHHLMPIYVGSALIMDRREEVLKCECEMPALHQLLSSIPATLNANKLLDAAQRLFKRYPPILLEGEYKRAYDNMVESERRKERCASKRKG